MTDARESTSSQAVEPVVGSSSDERIGSPPPPPASSSDDGKMMAMMETMTQLLQQLAVTTSDMNSRIGRLERAMEDHGAFLNGATIHVKRDGSSQFTEAILKDIFRPFGRVGRISMSGWGGPFEVVYFETLKNVQQLVDFFRGGFVDSDDGRRLILRGASPPALKQRFEEAGCAFDKPASWSKPTATNEAKPFSTATNNAFAKGVSNPNATDDQNDENNLGGGLWGNSGDDGSACGNNGGIGGLGQSNGCSLRRFTGPHAYRR